MKNSEQKLKELRSVVGRESCIDKAIDILRRGFSEKNISFRPAQFRGKELVSFTMHNWQKQTLNDMKVRDKGLQVTGVYEFSGL